LLELGRIGDARSALELGVEACALASDAAVFQRGLVLLALREKNFAGAGKVLAKLPNNVTPLDLMRLHVDAAQNHSREAVDWKQRLASRKDRMNQEEGLVFTLVQRGFGISDSGVGRQPGETELTEIFEAEIELLLAA